MDTDTSSSVPPDEEVSPDFGWMAKELIRLLLVALINAIQSTRTTAAVLQ